MNNDMASQYDYSISMIRAMSMVAIITCHFMQYLDIELAWWFNVGVQVFLCNLVICIRIEKLVTLLNFIKKRFKRYWLTTMLLLLSHLEHIG